MEKAELEELIRARIACGQSQKSVARELGVTEWRVRCVVRSEVTRLIVRREAKDVRLHQIAKERVQTIRCLILSDIHIPYHDHSALALALAYAKDYKPTHIVLNGDIIDAQEISSHPKDKHNPITFQDEVNEARQFLRVLRHQHKKATIVYTMGNHEHRLERYLTAHAPELASVDALALDELLELREHRIEFVDQRCKVSIGPFEVFHGSIIRKDAGNSVRGHMTRRGGSVVMGHTHRMGIVARTDRNGIHWGIENGHLSDPDPDWTHDPDWQQGFSQIDVHGETVSLRQHHIHDWRLLVDGTLYLSRGQHGQPTQDDRSRDATDPRALHGNTARPRRGKPLAKRGASTRR
jgi:UDP-2,3-diacylglucosamine pyrophosphatase LpxH